ncbi:MAG: hypothetical protein WDO71_21995 [Bacteroidota bacterium]
MKPLIVLIIVFGMSVFAPKLTTHKYDFPLSARIAMSAMLLFTAMGHFIFTKGMAMMVPDFIPFKIEMVYLTGIIEIVAAIGLLIPGLRVLTAWLLILFFLLLLPSNIIAAIKQIDIEKGTLNGSGLNYLWFRIPLQILFIVWTYISSIRF